MFHRTWLTVGVAALLAACGSEEEPGRPGRGPLGKADLAGSCSVGGTSYCGKKSAAGCWCDAACKKYGDCCADRAAVCDGDDGGTATCTPLASNAPQEYQVKDLYFSPNLEPWTTCYTVSTQEALALVQKGEFDGASEIVPETATASGDTVTVKLRYRDGNAQIGPCLYDKTDSCTYQCVIEFTDYTTEPEFFVEKEKSCSAAHPELKGKYIDCAAKLAHPVTNTWKQAVPRMSYKIIKHLLATNNAQYLQTAAIGGVVAGGSLDACMDWSAGLAFDLAERRMYPELCDWALSGITTAWNEAWCPWGLVIVRVKCGGLPELVNPEAKIAYPLDLSRPELKAYCGGSPTSAPCAGHCGGKSPTGCYCDTVCAQYGDCCPDLKQSCPGT